MKVHFNYFQALHYLAKYYYWLSFPLNFFNSNVNFNDIKENKQIPNSPLGTPIDISGQTEITLHYDLTMPSNANISRWHTSPFLFDFYNENNLIIVNKIKEIIGVKKIIFVRFIWYKEETDAKLYLKDDVGNSYLVRFMFEDFYNLNLKDWKKRKFDATSNNNPLVPFFNYEAQKDILDLYQKAGVLNIPNILFAGTIKIPIKKPTEKVCLLEGVEIIDNNVYYDYASIKFLILDYIEGDIWAKEEQSKQDDVYAEQVADFFYKINKNARIKTANNEKDGFKQTSNADLEVSNNVLKHYFKTKMRIYSRLALDIATYKELVKQHPQQEEFLIQEDFPNGKRYFEDGKELKLESILSKDYYIVAKAYLELYKKYLRTRPMFFIYCYTDFATFNTIISKDKKTAYLIDFNRLSKQFGFSGVAGGIIGRFESDEKRVRKVCSAFRKKSNKQEQKLFNNALLDSVVSRIFSLKDTRLNIKQRKRKKERYLKIKKMIER